MATTEVSGRLSPLAQLGLLVGPLLSMVDSSIVNVAVPDVAAELGASLDTVQWVVSGYLLSLAAALAATSYLARRFGTRRVYAASMIGFVLASALCAVAPSAPALIVARVQGHDHPERPALPGAAKTSSRGSGGPVDREGRGHGALIRAMRSSSPSSSPSGRAPYAAPAPPAPGTPDPCTTTTAARAPATGEQRLTPARTPAA
jgi:hypothetical protein